MLQPGETATWFRVSSRRVLSLFIESLARSHGWQRLYIVSPWISDFDADAGMSFRQVLKRLKDDDATAYVVSRPPEETWHSAALQEIAQTGKANIALVPELHTKLFCAETDQGAFALLGSANLTRLSLTNREIGVLLRASGAGTSIVKSLIYEATDIYRMPNRRLLCKRKF